MHNGPVRCNFRPSPGVMHLSDGITVQSPATEGGSATDFAAFMRRHQDMVYSTASRLSGNDAQAEDITQEVFLRAHRHYAELHDNPRAAGWLRTVATNLTFTYLTRYRRRWVFFSQMQEGADGEDDVELPFTSDADVDGDAQQGERHAIIEQALRELPEQQRVPLVLFHFEDMPYEEIAAKLRVSLAKIKTDIHRGRIALARVLAARGITAAEAMP
jgi:RNA polymerase sigma-70 factor (ECF subfamily)